MHRTFCRAVVATMLVAAPLSTVHAARPEPTGFDASRASALSTVPVRIVVLNDRLRTQWTYGSMDVVESYVVQNAVNNSIAAMPGGYAVPGNIAAGALGGAIAGAMIDAAMRADAARKVSAADERLDAAKCRLDLGGPLADAVARAVAKAPWAGAPVDRRVLDARGSLKDAVADAPQREELLVSYSMTPDYASLITTIGVSTYVDTLRAADARKKDPAWTDELVIVSDPVALADKTPQDVDAAVAAENARYAGTDAARLIRAANAGDREARKAAVALVDEHNRRMKEATLTSWTPAQASLARAEHWVADDCALLRRAASQHAQEAEALLGRMFAGQLPPRVDRAELGADVTQPGTERDVLARAVGVYVFARGGTSPEIAHRYSWLPLPKTRK